MATPFTRSSFNTPALNSFASARNRRELLMRKGLRDLRRSGREAARYGSPGAVTAVTNGQLDLLNRAEAEGFTVTGLRRFEDRRDQTIAAANNRMVQAETNDALAQAAMEMTGGVLNREPEAGAQRGTGESPTNAQRGTGEPKASAQRGTGEPKASAQRGTGEPKASAQRGTGGPGDPETPGLDRLAAMQPEGGRPSFSQIAANAARRSALSGAFGRGAQDKARNVEDRKVLFNDMQEQYANGGDSRGIYDRAMKLGVSPKAFDRAYRKLNREQDQAMAEAEREKKKKA